MFDGWNIYDFKISSLIKNCTITSYNLERILPINI
jgi:hypothetical protein